MVVAQQQTGGSGLLPLLILGLIVLGMYFFMIRPQQRQRREMQQMQSRLGPGDQVITLGGLYGTVVEVDDESVTLEVAPGVTNRYVRGAIGRIVTPKSGSESGGEASGGKA